jgi:hypothetical protein
MSRVKDESFIRVDEADLSDYAEARAAEMELIIATPFRRTVLENLTALQAHARRVSAALDGLDGAPAEAREI